MRTLIVLGLIVVGLIRSHRFVARALADVTGPRIATYHAGIGTFDTEMHGLGKYIGQQPFRRDSHDISGGKRNIDVLFAHVLGIIRSTCVQGSGGVQGAVRLSAFTQVKNG